MRSNKIDFMKSLFWIPFFDIAVSTLDRDFTKCCLKTGLLLCPLLYLFTKTSVHMMNGRDITAFAISATVNVHNVASCYDRDY
jgi:hypothetical protein